MRAPLASRYAAAAVFVLAAALAGCLMGPNYQRPAAAVPPAYRAPGAAAAAQPAPGLGAEKW
ncbi:MAG: efflux transporter outer membrane subunit, partial [Terriglobales bacterium]